MATKKETPKTTVIVGFRVIERLVHPQNMYIVEKLAKNAETGEIEVVGIGCGIPLRKSEVIDRNAFIEITKYIEISANKAEFDFLKNIITKENSINSKVNSLIGERAKNLVALTFEYQQKLELLNNEFKVKVDDANLKYNVENSELNNELENLKLFKDNMLFLIDQSFQKAKK